MYVLAVCAAVCLGVLLLLEGQSFQRLTDEHPHMRWFGALTLFISIPFVLLQMLLLSRALVYSPEFSALLVQGAWAKYLLEGALATVAVAATLLWQVARVEERLPDGKKDRVWLLLRIVGLAVAVITVAEIHPLAGGTDPAVYAYDLWWPPLTAWLTICLTQSAAVLIELKGTCRRPAVTALALLVVASVALSRPELVDQWSARVWKQTIVIAASLLVALIAIGVLRFHRSEEKWREWLQHRRYDLTSLRLKSLLPVVGVLVPVLTFGRIVRLETAGPALALSALAFAWIMLAEAFGGEPLMAASQWRVIRSFREGGSLRSAMSGSWTTLGRAGSNMFAWWRTKPAEGTAAPVGAVALRVVLAIAIVVALSDLPNAQRTLIYPFSSGDLIEGKDIAQEFPTWVLREIDRLQRELAPLMLVSNPQDRGQAIAAAPTVNGIDAAISKSNDLEFWQVKVPLSLFIYPIQTPVRKAIGARVITGTLHGDSESYSAVAMSSTGEIWSATAPARGPSEARKPVDVLNALAAQLAFQIITTSIPTTAGLTRLPEAFADFRQGLIYWNEYQHENWDSLAKSIEQFRSAIEKDPSFSLAYYRLGVALQEEARPSAAAEAFTTSINLDPMFTPSYVAKANVLHDFDWYQSRLPAADAVDRLQPALSEQEQKEREIAANSRLEEARRLWRKVLTLDTGVVSLSDRAASYFGLCNDARDRSVNKKEKETDQDTELRRQATHAAYYYCRRAEDMYARMHSDDPQITTTHAWVLDTLGLLFQYRLETSSMQITSDWHCSERTINFNEVNDDGTVTARVIEESPYLGYALGYYGRALALTPLDPVIRCNQAATAYAMGNAEPMRTLETMSDAHAQLASMMPYDDMHPVRAHRAALSEYQQAVVRDPSNTDARNGYAYRFWEWSFAAAQRRVPSPEAAVAEMAETFARDAVRIGDRTSGSPAHQSMLLSTLGEVLLAKGRAHEAIEWLRKGKELSPAHTVGDQVRWDLAQADLCAIAADQGRGDVDDEIKRNLYEAEEMAALVDAHNRGRETPEKDSWVDLVRPSRACIAPGQPEMPMYALMKEVATAHMPCEWLGVRAQLDAAGGQKAFLRVIGGEARQTVPADGAAYMFLTSAPAPTHAVFFAKLEDENGNALSRTQAFDTYADCSQNLITLVFQPAPAGTARSNNLNGTR